MHRPNKNVCMHERTHARTPTRISAIASKRHQYDHNRIFIKLDYCSVTCKTNFFSRSFLFPFVAGNGEQTQTIMMRPIRIYVAENDNSMPIVWVVI